jgi:hypothetical protein
MRGHDGNRRASVILAILVLSAALAATALAGPGATAADPGHGGALVPQALASGQSDPAVTLIEDQDFEGDWTPPGWDTVDLESGQGEESQYTFGQRELDVNPDGGGEYDAWSVGGGQQGGSLPGILGNLRGDGLPYGPRQATSGTYPNTALVRSRLIYTFDGRPFDVGVRVNFDVKADMPGNHAVLAVLAFGGADKYAVDTPDGQGFEPGDKFTGWCGWTPFNALVDQPPPDLVFTNLATDTANIAIDYLDTDTGNSCGGNDCMGALIDNVRIEGLSSMPIHTPTATRTAASPTATATHTTPTASAPPTAHPTGAPPAVRVCPVVSQRVPAVVVANALANPQRVYGWGMPVDPGKPVSPANPLRTSLSLRNVGIPYHPIWNSVVWRSGCQ